jgi:hypothetical protein
MHCSNFEKFGIIIKTGVSFVDKNTKNNFPRLVSRFSLGYTKIRRVSREDGA